MCVVRRNSGHIMKGGNVPELQPSSDFEATCMAVAYDMARVFSRIGDVKPADQAVIERAKLVRRAYYILRHGKEPGEGGRVRVAGDRGDE